MKEKENYEENYFIRIYATISIFRNECTKQY